MQVIDEDNLAIVAIATGLLQLVYFLITWSCRVHKLSDFAAGSNFFFIAFLSLCLGQTFYWRQIVMTLLVLVWGCRLSGYLLYRMYHVGEDLRISEDTTLKQFAAFWSFQLVWVYTVSLPIIYINSPTCIDKVYGPRFGTAQDIIGIIMFIGGVLLETFADMQKFWFRTNPANNGKWCTYGLWRWSRHPNYFGEMLVWWGAWLVSTSILHNFQWFATLSPVFITILLLFFSGIPLLEHKADITYGKHKEYQAYKRGTSVLIPMPQCIYQKMAPNLRFLMCCDFPLYDFLDEATPVSV